MWTLVILSILGLNIPQASGQEESTQMYYFQLEIEGGVIQLLLDKLGPEFGTPNVTLSELKITTTCHSNNIECECEDNFRWSDKVCLEHKCGIDKINFTDNTTPKCVSKDRVVVNGSITLNGAEDHNCLERNTTEKYKTCNEGLIRKMKTVFSTLRGFDTIQINNYRTGSVIADFEVTYASRIDPPQLLKKLKELIANLEESQATLRMETNGIINMSAPSGLVCQADQPTITCVSGSNLGIPVWTLENKGRSQEIFTGTASTVTRDPTFTSVNIHNVSQLWAGNYTCAYNDRSDGIDISHKASSKLDISVLPDIQATVIPAFPRCPKTSAVLAVRVKCEVGSTAETYNITWEAKDLYSGPFEETQGVVITILSCNDTTLKPQVTCSFMNRCDDIRNATVNVQVIHVKDKFCEPEGEWPETKVGFKATLNCQKQAGIRRRKCSLDRMWEPEVSECVNKDVDSLVLQANLVDLGLGAKNENGANVFAQLQNVTQNRENINSFNNMNASVQVLQSLSERIDNIENSLAVNDFLESSSNMLEKSLNQSWKTSADKVNVSLAERYLDSVEHLIEMANISAKIIEKQNLEVATTKCTRGSHCNNKVFGVSVDLGSLDSKSPDPGRVSTAGFKELENYLPSNDTLYEPNSIVVSVTTEKKQMHPKVQLRFQLRKLRPRNTRLLCVSWNNSIRDWSEEGCKWMGSWDEELCICEHLSSYAILMSRYPKKIEGLDEVTYVGLSVSIVSLIINLAIEIAVWSSVVKTNTLYLRHTAHVNISLCLLFADCFFLASAEPSQISPTWCKISTVLKHFCYLSMFFWMMCLSSMLLHQAVFLFHNVSKKTYLRLALGLGYVCPFMIVAATFFTYSSGAEGQYYSSETCWLLYTRLMQGSIHSFVLPIGIIVFFNVFSMMVVILKLLNHPMNSDKCRDKQAAVTIMRSVILLTPIFGVTWVFGFAIMIVDLTDGVIANIIHYIFTLLNAFQGFFILLTTCLGDKLTREALRSRLKKHAPASMTESTMKSDSFYKK